ncbi:hypothetical protein [Reichenbachiella sp. MALMAid0571]|uniref:hypothetical protein n=1 Tax=Reichenbachiella sp. MALMAid0571 TaxID=3143939 RepID=UPI0032DFBBAD
MVLLNIEFLKIKGIFPPDIFLYANGSFIDVIKEGESKTLPLRNGLNQIDLGVRNTKKTYVHHITDSNVEEDKYYIKSYLSFTKFIVFLAGTLLLWGGGWLAIFANHPIAGILLISVFLVFILVDVLRHFVIKKRALYFLTKEY